MSFLKYADKYLHNDINQKYVNFIEVLTRDFAQ